MPIKYISTKLSFINNDINHRNYAQCVIDVFEVT